MMCTHPSRCRRRLSVMAVRARTSQYPPPPSRVHGMRAQGSTPRGACKAGCRLVIRLCRGASDQRTVSDDVRRVLTSSFRGRTRCSAAFSAICDDGMVSALCGIHAGGAYFVTDSSARSPEPRFRRRVICGLTMTSVHSRCSGPQSRHAAHAFGASQYPPSRVHGVCAQGSTPRRL